jgi:hypothetical protein
LSRHLHATPPGYAAGADLRQRVKVVLGRLEALQRAGV